MILVFGFLDRVLDIVGICALIFWTWKFARWFYRRRVDRKAVER
jgi:hypothetical protein